jgi:16S rRNA G966 N2-methylase RsmD
MEVAAAINRLHTESKLFNLIFMDPPYSRDFIPQTLEILASAEILHENGIIVAERDKKDEIPEQAGPYILYRNQKYGDTIISFYRIQI